MNKISSNTSSPFSYFHNEKKPKVSEGKTRIQSMSEKLISPQIVFSKKKRVYNWIKDKAQSIITIVQKLYYLFLSLKSSSSISSVPLSSASNAIFIVPKSNFYTPLYGAKWTNLDRAAVYKDSIRAMDYGYQLNGRMIILDNNDMMLGVRFYESIKELEPVKNPLKTTFYVETDDTFNVLLKLKNEGKNPVGINMAHSTRRGGGVVRGCPAQEECEYRRSNYRKIDSIAAIRKAVLKEGVIYTPSLYVFRKDESEGFAFMEQPQAIATVAVAGFDFRKGSFDRLELGLHPCEPISEELLRGHSAYINGTKNRIRNMLRAMAQHGHKDIVLGALGCGAFENPPTLVADLFDAVFNEQEFKGRFASVCFAILLKSYDKDHLNVDVFQNLCCGLQ